MFVLFNSNTTGSTSEAGAAYPSITTEYDFQLLIRFVLPNREFSV